MRDFPGLKALLSGIADRLSHARGRAAGHRLKDSAELGPLAADPNQFATRHPGGHGRIDSVSGQPINGLFSLPRGAETVLVVDDNASVRQSTHRVLRFLGYSVLDATSGPEALDMLVRHAEIDLLFTDVVMPGGMSGIAMAAQAQRLRPGLPVLFTSGYAVEAEGEPTAAPPHHDMLSKPYRRSDLAQRIRAALDQRPRPDPT